MKKITLLVVEDEEAIRDLLRFSLPANEFILRDAETISQAMRSLSDHIPDLIILDWMLPDKSGIELIKWIKHKETLKDIPIIMLTAKAEEAQKVQGLMAGADDYVTKPFSTLELTARIKAVLRRGLLASPENEVSIGSLTINTVKHTVLVGNQSLKLMPLEYKLLYFFVTHPNKIYSRDHLLTHVWGGDVYIEDRTVDVLIRRVRSKLKPYNLHTMIKTIRSSGYIFSPEKDEKKEA